MAKKDKKSGGDSLHEVTLTKTGETKRYVKFAEERDEDAPPATHIVSVYMPKDYKGDSIKVTISKE